MKKYSQTIWRTLISVRLTITLLLVLTALCIIGTLVAQQGMSPTPLEKLYSERTLKILVTLGLTDVFHSSGFVLVLFLLALNLISCSYERLPKVWHQAFYVDPPPVQDPTLKEWTPEFAKKQKYRIERFSEQSHNYKSTSEAKLAATLFVQKRFKQYLLIRDNPNEFQISVEKGKYSRLGVYITHLSLLMIMFGGAAGGIWGFEGLMGIEEGTRQSWLQHSRGSDGGLPLMKERGVPVPGYLNLGFEVECEKFSLETYDGERPKAFKSKLHFYENDVKVHSAEIAVNHPTDYKGITFYQASYNQTGIGSADIKVYRVKAKGTTKEREPSSDIKKPQADLPTMLPKNQKPPEIQSVELVEAVKIGEIYRVDGQAGFKVLSLEENMMNLGPAARVEFYTSKTDKKGTQFWIFKNLPGFDFAHRQGTSLHFVLDRLNPKFVTGLSVAKDPGVWVVWVGSAILILALFLALYTCHSRIWIAYKKDEGFAFVGWSNKLFLFTPVYDRFLNEFKKEVLQ